MIYKIDSQKNSYVLEIKMKNGAKNSIAFPENSKDDLKLKVKQFKKNGTITFSIVDENKEMKTATIEPASIKVMKVVEAYINKEEEQHDTTHD